MPIVRINDKILYFCHIPKCGGSSVELYLDIVSNGNIGFIDPNHITHAKDSVWSSSSPQHIDGISLGRLFPKGIIDEYFVVTRNPFDRFISAYRYQKHKLKSSNFDDVNSFADSLSFEKINKLGWADNHFLPQFKFLVPGAKTTPFKLEEGLDRVKIFLDRAFFGNDLLLQIPHENKSEALLFDPSEFILTDKTKGLIREWYSRDFELFNY
jgi:hypothetical protein